MGFANIHNTKERWDSPRTISDFPELNKCIVRKPYPIPKISTTLQELEGFTYVTALDLNMGYYTIRLDSKSSKMCTIIFPREGTRTRDSQWDLEGRQTSSKPKLWT
jgi:hypothetical protein